MELNRFTGKPICTSLSRLAKMKGAILEVVLVDAQGIDRTIIFGRPNYYVIVECGAQNYRSKRSSGRLDRVYWNEKFTFEFLPSELETVRHLRLRILKDGFFSSGKFVGETMIFLRGIFVEGSNNRGMQLSPAPFNVILKDKTYRGRITVALKFIPDVDINMEGNHHSHTVQDPHKSLRQMVENWFRLLISCGNTESLNEHKES